MNEGRCGENRNEEWISVGCEELMRGIILRIFSGDLNGFVGQSEGFSKVKLFRLVQESTHREYNGWIESVV